MFARNALLTAIILATCLCVLGFQRWSSWRGAKPSQSAQAINPEKTAITANDSYGPPVKIASLKNRAVNESSGIVASRTTPGLYWTHNDSGDGPFIYAFDIHGVHRGVWRVTGAEAHDWESISMGPGPESNKNYLYIGDIGDNDARRSSIEVYRVAEPTITAGDSSSTKSKPRLSEPAELIRLRYPDGKYDAEALLVHPRTGNLYLVTKQALANPRVYKATAPLKVTSQTTLEFIAELSVPDLLGGMITDGDVSPDGCRVALCDYLQGYELVLPDCKSPFDTIWKQHLKPITLGSRPQGEAIGYRLDGKALLATSEGSSAPLIQVVHR